MGKSTILAITLLMHTAVGGWFQSWQCSNVPQCRCTNHWMTHVLQSRCRNITSTSLEEFQLAKNVTSLTIYDSRLENASTLQQLETIDAKLTRLTIFKTHLNKFSWKWMPTSLVSIHLSITGITDIYSKKFIHANGTTEYQCDMAHLKMLTRVLIKEDHMHNIPSCIPPATESLLLISANLRSLEEPQPGFEKGIKWPTLLRKLHLQNNSLSQIPTYFFQSSPTNLTNLTIKDQPKITETGFLQTLPAISLTNLCLQNISVTVVSELDWRNFRKINILEALTITHTLLTSIPHGLPGSIVNLQLHDNKIAELNTKAFSSLVNLKKLNLKNNKIRIVPKGLPESLEEIILENNGIVSLSSEAFSSMQYLHTLFLSHNRLDSMPKGIPPRINQYSISSNIITDIGPPSNYEFCYTCQVFTVGGNPWDCNNNLFKFLLWNSKRKNHTVLHKKTPCNDGIPGLPGQTLGSVMGYVQYFENLGCSYNITSLQCNNNQMNSIPRLHKALEEIRIMNNPKFGQINGSSFNVVISLKVLELRNIGLKKVPNELPSSITTLKLGYNEIIDFSNDDMGALHRLRSLRYLDLRHNRLTTFSLTAIQPLLDLRWVYLEGNPLSCGCALMPFIKWTSKRKTGDNMSDNFEQSLVGQCVSPSSIKGKDISKLSGYFTSDRACYPKNCEWDGTHPVINCSMPIQTKATNVELKLHEIPPMPANSYWQNIDLSNLQLKDADINLTHLSGLLTVTLTNTSLTGIPIKGLPRTIKNILVSNNNISSLPSLKDVQSNFKKLESIDLRSNNIKTVTEDGISLFQNLSSLKLHGNPLICDCKIRPLFSWISANHDLPERKQHKLKTLRCHRPKAIRGKAIISLKDNEYCPNVSISVVVGGLVGGVLFLVLLFFVVLGYYHKQGKIREREAILQGFRDLLQQEADVHTIDPETGSDVFNNYKYDAFLSYSPHDEDSDFAAMLLDELEMKYSYKICVHERDFTPGLGIADNIVECIGTSKRIILVLSTHFLSSSWCQYEVQVALTELHQKRKSKLLIPILLEDLDETVGGSVKTFLSIIKSIKIPSDNRDASWNAFWQEVIQAMPDLQTQEHTV